MAQKKIVHIVGTGTIGEPLVGILSTFKEQFGIDEVTFHNRTPLLTDRSKVQVSCANGAKLAVDKESRHKFIEMGMTPSFEAEEAIERASVVIDCTPVGNMNKEKLYNKYANNGRGFIAQGSEDGFGKMLVLGLDGFDPGLVERYMAEGILPNFTKLVDGGTFARVATSNPPQSPVAWSCLI